MNLKKITHFRHDDNREINVDNILSMDYNQSKWDSCYNVTFKMVGGDEFHCQVKSVELLKEELK